MKMVTNYIKDLVSIMTSKSRILVCSGAFGGLEACSKFKNIDR